MKSVFSSLFAIYALISGPRRLLPTTVSNTVISTLPDQASQDQPGEWIVLTLPSLNNPSFNLDLEWNFINFSMNFKSTCDNPCAGAATILNFTIQQIEQVSCSERIKPISCSKRIEPVSPYLIHHIQISIIFSGKNVEIIMIVMTIIILIVVVQLILIIYNMSDLVDDGSRMDMIQTGKSNNEDPLKSWIIYWIICWIWCEWCTQKFYIFIQILYHELLLDLVPMMPKNSRGIAVGFGANDAPNRFNKIVLDIRSVDQLDRSNKDFNIYCRKLLMILKRLYYKYS